MWLLCKVCVSQTDDFINSTAQTGFITDAETDSYRHPTVIRLSSQNSVTNIQTISH